MDCVAVGIEAVLLDLGYISVQEAVGEQESGGDAFLADERGIAALLSAQYDAACAKLYEAIEEMDGGAEVDWDKLIEETEARCSKIYEREEPRFSELFDSLWQTGREQVPVLVQNAPKDTVQTRQKREKKVKDGLQRQARYYSDTFFSREVKPAMRKKIEQVLRDASTGISSLGQIKMALQAKLKNVPYWKLVANVAASRAYHYGLAFEAYHQGYTMLRIKAVLDSRTSQICRSLNGRMIPIDKAIEQAEKLAAARPGKEKDISPWYSIKQIKGKTDKQLVKMGILLPPYHGNCRTVVVAAGRRQSR